MKLFLLLCLALLVACDDAASADPPSVPTPSESTVVAQVSPEPDTPVATATIPPVVTRLIQPTADASPTEMVSSTPTNTNTPAPTVPPEPVALYTLEDFGTDRNPFTGEWMADSSLLQRRPIACKISNHPPEWTRPQAGLNEADLVFEHLNAWVSTRFTAIFYGRTPTNVGPIRSGRLIDLELPAMYDTALCFSGANPAIIQELLASDIGGRRMLFSGVDGYYRLDDEERPSEHTLYADLTGLWGELEERDRNTPPAITTNMAFTTEPPAGGEPASHIIVRYHEEQVDWRYDPANGRYWRWTDGEVHRDANTGDQLNFTNVVALFAVHMPSPKSCAVLNETGCEVQSIEIQLWGRGEAIIYRDGLAYHGTWRRDQRNAMLTFYDANNNPIPLQVGNTLFHVLTTHLSDQLDHEP